MKDIISEKAASVLRIRPIVLDGCRLKFTFNVADNEAEVAITKNGHEIMHDTLLGLDDYKDVFATVADILKMKGGK